MLDETLIDKAKPLPRLFYEKSVVDVAKNLLGKILVREYDNKILAGMIVEVEAYNGQNDPASHAYRGKTKRNKVMWKNPGTIYVYTIYGIHYCLNLVAEPKGIPAAILIRALQPILGIQEMMKNREIYFLKNLTNGPAKLTKALKIDIKLNGRDATVKGPLYVIDNPVKKHIDIISSSRIGIKQGKDKPWRFYIKDNEFISKK